MPSGTNNGKKRKDVKKRTKTPVELRTNQTMVKGGGNREKKPGTSPPI